MRSPYQQAISDALAKKSTVRSKFNHPAFGDDVIEAMIDMASNPNSWPIQPILPIKRYQRGDGKIATDGAGQSPEVGILLEGNGAKVIITPGGFGLIDPNLLHRLVVINYPDMPSAFADGWEID